MAAFSHNYHSGESRASQYQKYLQTQNYVNQIDNAIRETGEMNATVVAIQTREVQHAIQVSSESQREAIIQASRGICSTLESGFSDLNYSLEDIKNGMSRLSSLVGHGFSLLLEGQKITHQYLGHVQNLLRLPDSQKERVYHIEEGMKYLHNAFRQGADSDFYKDAFDEFNESKGGEGKDVKDFISLYYIGLIHLKSLDPHLQNPQKAESSFRTSARYYLAEHSIGGTNFSNNLLQSDKTFALGAAEAYLFAAEACYIQEKVSEAVVLATEAWKTLPEMTKAGFMQSKYLAANRQVNEAVQSLEKVIRTNRFLALEVLPDLDLTSKPEIIDLLEELRVEAVQEAQAQFELCRKVILPNSTATSYLASIDTLIRLGTFLEAKEATDLLLVSKSWTIRSGAQITSQGQVLAKISSQDFTGSLIDFIKFERERVLALPKANALIRIEEIEKQKAVIQNEVNDLQSKVDRQSSEIGFLWKTWGGGILIWAVVLVIGIACSPAKNLITVLLVLLSIIVIWVGGALLALAAIYVIAVSISKGVTISFLKSKISSREKSIWDRDNDIKKLQLTASDPARFKQAAGLLTDPRW
jgi:tetratricopeptide (TPR) repeat protein